MGREICSRIKEKVEEMVESFGRCGQMRVCVWEKETPSARSLSKAGSRRVIPAWALRSNDSDLQCRFKGTVIFSQIINMQIQFMHAQGLGMMGM